MNEEILRSLRRFCTYVILSRVTSDDDVITKFFAGYDRVVRPDFGKS